VKKGMFVTFEGVEGCGKSTQVDRLLGGLVTRRVPAVAVREPGSTPIGQEIRSILLDPAHTEMVGEAELLLYEASRAQLVRTVIEPGLSKGHAVLSDRYADSTVAYQCFGRGIARATVDAVNDVATGGLMPDLTVLLDVPVRVGIARVRGELDRIEQESVEFHERVKQGFLALAAEEPARFLLLDGTRSEQELATQVLERVLELL
jgi:dTMP kinase